MLTPLIHWLPARWQRVLVPRITVWGLLTKAGPEERRFYFEHYLRDICLLTATELQELFPESRLIQERVLGWTKSLIATRRAP